MNIIQTNACNDVLAAPPGVPIDGSEDLRRELVA